MNTETTQFGVHYMLDGYGADANVLSNIELLTKVLHEVPAQMGMHNICEPVVVEVGPKNRKDPGGISGFVMIAESHLSFHTFPNRGFITLDIYTCQNDLDSGKLTKKFVELFKLENYDEKVIPRGTEYPVDDVA